jgi:prophage antirepressor-like protein
MKLTEVQIKEILDSALPDVVAGLKTELKEMTLNQIKWSADETIGKFIRQWLSENILPEIEKTLIESKAGLVATAVLMAEQSMALIAKAHAESLAKRLESSYSREKILKSILGD